MNNIAILEKFKELTPWYRRNKKIFNILKYFMLPTFNWISPITINFSKDYHYATTQYKKGIIYAGYFFGKEISTGNVYKFLRYAKDLKDKTKENSIISFDNEWKLREYEVFIEFKV